MKEYKAENGNVIVAVNDVQEAAFEQAGLVAVEEVKRGRPKSE